MPQFGYINILSIGGRIDISKAATVRARLEPHLKAEVESLFEHLGLSTTEAITLFYRQVKLRRGLPFNVVVPNKTTEKVFRDTDAKRNLVRCGDAKEMFEKLKKALFLLPTLRIPLRINLTAQTPEALEFQRRIGNPLLLVVGNLLYEIE